jgi:hypothetical protein
MLVAFQAVQGHQWAASGSNVLQSWCYAVGSSLRHVPEVDCVGDVVCHLNSPFQCPHLVMGKSSVADVSACHVLYCNQLTPRFDG